MKFLCVPCDSQMKLQSVGPPERGSLSVVYSCPECGYEMAMLTNAYETQVVQSLGVRIGPESDGKAVSTSGTGCPFTGMIPGIGESRPDQAGARCVSDGVELPSLSTPLQDSTGSGSPGGLAVAPSSGSAFIAGCPGTAPTYSSACWSSSWRLSSPCRLR